MVLQAKRAGLHNPALSVSGMVRYEMARKSRAYSYLRFSSARQADGDSIRRQSEAAERYAQAHGLTLDKSLSFRDLGVSAFEGRNAREGGALRAFVSAIDERRVPKGSVLLVENLDRLSRQTARVALRTLEEIVDKGVDVVTLTDGQRYTPASLDGMGLFFALIPMMRANEESAMKSARGKAAWAGARKRYGKDAIIPGQKVPFWVQVHPTTRRPSVDGTKGKVAARIAREYLAGRRLREIVRGLNSDAIKSPQGGTWSRVQVSRTLRNLAPKEATSPLSQPERTRLRAALSRRKSGQGGRGRGDGETNVLRGLGRCGYCGASLTFARAPKTLGNGKTTDYHYLRCVTNAETPGRCEGPGHIRYEPIAQAVVELAVAVADRPPPVSSKTADTYTTAAKVADATFAKADKLRIALEASPSKEATLALRSAWLAYQDAQETADRAWDAARPGYAAVDVEAIKTASSDEQMNRALRAFLDRVEVRHGDPGPDDGTITFHYLGGGEAGVRYKAAPRKRSDAGKSRRRRSSGR
jgi:DNA invertase Pin-like site-specific DNA recombinase